MSNATSIHNNICTSSTGINTKTQKNNNPVNTNVSKQAKIIHYLTPPHRVNCSTPTQIHKQPTFPRLLPSQINLKTTFDKEVTSNAEPLPQRTLTTAPQWKQTPLSKYFRITPRPVVPKPPKPAVSTQAKSKSLRHTLISYKRPKRQLTKITRFTSHMPTYDLFDSWGHTMESVDTNSTFRVFLQNPNGLSIHKNNLLLLQDFQSCYDYGVGALCLPETNTNWTQGSQVATLHQLFKRAWRTSVLQMSHTPDQFFSNYQPGGTLTAISDQGL